MGTAIMVLIAVLWIKTELDLSKINRKVDELMKQKKKSITNADITKIISKPKNDCDCNTCPYFEPKERR